MTRRRYPLNDQWWFSPEFDKAMQFGQRDSKWQQVRLPHTVFETPYNYFSEQHYQGLWGYGREVVLPKGESTDSPYIWSIRFEGAAHVANVYLDGVKIGAHIGGYTGFKVELPEQFLDGRPHWLSLSLDSSEQLNCPPFGHVVDYLTYGGIYREVYLERSPKVCIGDVYAYGQDLLTDAPKIVVSMDSGCMQEMISKAVPFALRFELNEMPMVSDFNTWHQMTSDNCSVWETILDETIPISQLRSEMPWLITLALPGQAGHKWHLWDLHNPRRYRLKITAKDTAGVFDEKIVDLGLREAYFDAEGFHLNGKLTKVVGVNRHQSYPYVGYAMPAGPQWHDAHIIKGELGMNAVRTAHYPQSHHFIEACDALGLLVFTEVPGWQHIGDDQWQATAVHMVREMVCEYRHHPSIVLWGVRINESVDSEAFYSATNQWARKLDPSRQTGGVRYLKNSQLLEDVYTFNDFSYNAVAKGQKGILPRIKVTSNRKAAYLVSEYNGHMFPTKSYDSIKHRAEHARRHARVLSDIGTEAGVAGGFAWCMFDYNTHKDFGSGDGICHHGILDMFRNHKLAAAVYSSQKPLDQGLVMAIDSELHIGDYPAGAMGPISIYTNAQRLNLYKNDIKVGCYRRASSKQEVFKGLTNPPFVLQDLVGSALADGEGYTHHKAERIKKLLYAGAQYGTEHLPVWAWLLAARLVLFDGFKLSAGLPLYSKYIGNWGDAMTQYTIEALHEDTVLGKMHLGTGGEPRLQVNVDRNHLFEGPTYDVACVRFKSVDSSGMHLPYDQSVVRLKATGSIELIGPEVIALQGGMGGTYVKTKEMHRGERGAGKLEIERMGSEVTVIDFIVNCESEGVFI